MPNERNRYIVDQYGQNPYIRNRQEGQNRQYIRPSRKRRRPRIRFQITGVGAAFIAMAIVAAGAIGYGLARRSALKPTATPTPVETPVIVVMPSDATPYKPSPSPLSPTPTPTPTPTPEPTPTPATAPPLLITDAPAGSFFTAGEVEVDYANMLYRSANLYVKVIPVSENGVDYYVADCRMRDSGRLFTAFATDKYVLHKGEKTSVMAKRKGAVIAISGDYFGASAADRSDRGIVIRNGTLYRRTPWYDIAAIFNDGTMKTYDKSEITANQLMKQGAVHAFSFGPYLMDGNGKALPESKIKARRPRYNPPNPRCGIGYIEPNHFVLVVVDGKRYTGTSRGMTTTEFAQLFEKLGCKSAYNLDGGGTATMVFMGKVINKPCDKGGERPVSDIIYFGESETDQANIERINSRQ